MKNIVIKIFMLVILPTTIVMAKDKILWSPKVSIFSTIYGISDFKGSNLPLIGVGLDWMVGKKVYYYGKVQFNYRFGNFLSTPERFIDQKALQFQLLGIGFYLLDTRNEQLSTGWSMVVNLSLGLGINFGNNGFKEWSDLNEFTSMESLAKGIGTIVYAPIEFSLYTRYHINTASAVQFGINIAGQLGGYNRLLYGFTLGFAF